MTASKRNDHKDTHNYSSKSILGNHVSYIGGLRRFSTDDGPGLRTTVYFKGCPLNCVWCDNPELISYDYQLFYDGNKCIGCGHCIKICPGNAISSDAGKLVFHMDHCSHCKLCIDGCYAEAIFTHSKKYTPEELLEEILKDKSLYEKTGGGVTLSGGEVITHFPLAYDIACLCKEYDISVALDTSGYGDYKALYRLARISDVILYNLKHMDRKIHKQYTGRDPVLIWSNLQGLCDHEDIRKKIVVRFPLIGSFNDSRENLCDLRELMEEYGLTIIQFLPYRSGVKPMEYADHKIKKQYREPSQEVLLHARDYFMEKEIKVIFPSS